MSSSDGNLKGLIEVINFLVFLMFDFKNDLNYASSSSHLFTVKVLDKQYRISSDSMEAIVMAAERSLRQFISVIRSDPEATTWVFINPFQCTNAINKMLQQL